MLSDPIRNYLKKDLLIKHALKKTGLRFNDLLKIRVRPPDSISLDHSIFPEAWPIIYSSDFEAISPNSTADIRAAFHYAVRPAVLLILYFSDTLSDSKLRAVLNNWLDYRRDNLKLWRLETGQKACDKGRKEGGKTTAELRKDAKDKRTAEVEKQWKKFKKQGVPEHERAGKMIILNEKGERITAQSVRNHIREAVLRLKKK